MAARNFGRLLVRNLPNALSAYRLTMAPAITVLAFIGNQTLFVVLILVSLITDVLDGLIARAFRLQTAFGAKLDSVADDATYIAAISGVFAFKSAALGPNLGLFCALVGMLALSSLVHLVRFHRFPSLHLYSFRISGYLQAGFLLILFTYGFQPLLFYIVCLLSTLACLEVIAVTLVIPHPVSNARGMYWVLRDFDSVGATE